MALDLCMIPQAMGGLSALQRSCRGAKQHKHVTDCAYVTGASTRRLSPFALEANLHCGPCLQLLEERGERDADLQPQQ